MSPKSEMFTVVALYHFATVEDPKALRSELERLGAALQLLGTLLVAPEGINGTVAGSARAIEAFVNELRSMEPFGGLEYKLSTAQGAPFYRFKVRVKKEIVTLGRPDIRPDERVGQYVAPQDWNALIDDPEVIVIDTRNHFEVEAGTFAGAVDPHTRSFREFTSWAEAHLADKKGKRIAMFCTGGIRCEKATSYLLSEGFENVFHLKGGILKYLEEVPEAESRWRGECFVFDQRVALKHGLVEGEHELCYGCRRPVAPQDKNSPLYEFGVACPRCADERTHGQHGAARERVKQMELASSRGEDKFFGIPFEK